MKAKRSVHLLFAVVLTILFTAGCGGGGVKMHNIAVKSVPTGANVVFDGKSYSNTPSTVQVPEDGQDHYLFITKKGCRDVRKIFRDNDYPDKLTLDLECASSFAEDSLGDEAGEGRGMGASRPGPGIEGLSPEEAKSRFVNDDVYFAFDSSTLDGAATDVLTFKAEWLRANPQAKIVVEGHTDSRGTVAYNLALGERRALSAKAFLENVGISSERILTLTYGEEFPTDPGQNEAAWAKNRRAHFVIKGAPSG